MNWAATLVLSPAGIWPAAWASLSRLAKFGACGAASPSARRAYCPAPGCRCACKPGNNSRQAPRSVRSRVERKRVCDPAAERFALSSSRESRTGHPPQRREQDLHDQILTGRKIVEYRTAGGIPRLVRNIRKLRFGIAVFGKRVRGGVQNSLPSFNRLGMNAPIRTAGSGLAIIGSELPLMLGEDVSFPRRSHRI